MKLKLTLYIDIDEENQKAMSDFDKQFGSGSCAASFAENIKELVADELPEGLTLINTYHQLLEN